MVNDALRNEVSRAFLGSDEVAEKVNPLSLQCSVVEVVTTSLR